MKEKKKPVFSSKLHIKDNRTDSERRRTSEQYDNNKIIRITRFNFIPIVQLYETWIKHIDEGTYTFIRSVVCVNLFFGHVFVYLFRKYHVNCFWGILCKNCKHIIIIICRGTYSCYSLHSLLQCFENKYLFIIFFY